MSNPLMEAMQQLQQMQAKMEQAQEALAGQLLSERGGGGMVTVTVNGLGRLTKVELAPEALAGDDREMVEDLLLTTINRALDRAKQLSDDQMGDAAKGMLPDIPGLNLPL